MNAFAKFDTQLTRSIQNLPESVGPVMSLATLLGEPVTVVIVALFTAGVAWRQNQHRVSAGLITAIAATGLNGILKMFIHRTRPDTLYVTNMRFKSFSFPSGHAFGSILIYGLLAYLAFKHLPSPWNFIAVVSSAILILLIGMSRVYLGAHFPTDVIGGWLLGAICLYIIIKVFF